MNKQEIGTLILRVLFGFTFLAHGLAKFQGGIANTVGFFESLGIPGFMAYAVAGVELVGGLALILGLGTRIIGAIFAIIMVVAIVTAKLPLGLLGDGVSAGYELELIFFAVSAYFVFANRSEISLDAKIFSNN